MNRYEILFWTFLSLVIYTYIGYGIILYLTVRVIEVFTKKKEKTKTHFEPNVTLIVAAYNEKRIIKEKIYNTLDLEYPKEKIQILFITDGSNDGTTHALKKHEEITVLHQNKRSGKTAAINRGFHYVKNPIVIFSDANAMLNKRAIREIVKHYEDPNIGCVAGEKRIIRNKIDCASGSGEGFYWRYESILKTLDYKLKTTIGAAGELFSIRTSLYQNINNNIILDDFIISMKTIQKGYKIAYEPKAFALESASISIKEEMKRKIRISAGGIQSIFLLYRLFNFFRYGIITFQLISHRFLRWTLTPLALFALIPINILVIYETNGTLYQFFLIGQIVFYTTALIGWLLENKNIKVRIAFIPYYFIFMNVCVVMGGLKYFTRSQSSVWEKSERA